MSMRDLLIGSEIAQLVVAVAATTGTLDFVRGSGKMGAKQAGILLLGLTQGWNTDAPNTATDIASFGLRIKRGPTAASATTLLKSLAFRSVTNRPFVIFDMPVRLIFTDNEPAIRINYASAAVATNDVVFDFHYVAI